MKDTFSIGWFHASSRIGNSQNESVFFVASRQGDSTSVSKLNGVRKEVGYNLSQT